VVGCCERNNEPSGSIKAGNFMKGLAPWRCNLPYDIPCQTRLRLVTIGNHVSLRLYALALKSSQCWRTLLSIFISKRLNPYFRPETKTRVRQMTRVHKTNSHDIFPQDILGLKINKYWHAGLRAVCSVVRVPAGAGNFSLHHRVQTGSGAHPASYPVVTKGSFPGGKAAGAWSWPLTSHLVPRSRVRWAIPPLTQYASMAWCSVKNKKHRDKKPWWLSRYSD
jgi:hypothetical protein